MQQLQQQTSGSIPHRPTRTAQSSRSRLANAGIGRDRIRQRMTELKSMHFQTTTYQEALIFVIENRAPMTHEGAQDCIDIAEMIMDRVDRGMPSYQVAVIGNTTVIDIIKRTIA